MFLDLYWKNNFERNRIAKYKRSEWTGHTLTYSGLLIHNTKYSYFYNISNNYLIFYNTYKLYL